MLRKGLKNFSLDNIHPAPIEGKNPNDYSLQNVRSHCNQSSIPTYNGNHNYKPYVLQNQCYDWAKTVASWLCTDWTVWLHALYKQTTHLHYVSL